MESLRVLGVLGNFDGEEEMTTFRLGPYLSRQVSSKFPTFSCFGFHEASKKKNEKKDIQAFRGFLHPVELQDFPRKKHM